MKAKVGSVRLRLEPAIPKIRLYHANVSTIKTVDSWEQETRTINR